MKPSANLIKLLVGVAMCLTQVTVAQAQEKLAPPAPAPAPPAPVPAPPAPAPSLPDPAEAARAARAADAATDAPLAGPGGLVCLASTIKGGTAKGQPLVVSVVANKADEFRGRGFTPTECTGVSRRTVGQRKTYCAAAATGNRSLTMAYWRLFAITPRELCQSVDALQSR